MNKSVNLYKIIQVPELMDQISLVNGDLLPLFKCEEIRAELSDCTFKVINAKFQTDFLFLSHGVLVYNKKVAKHMSSILEGLGEQIRLNTTDGTELYAANILETFNCLDVKLSIYEGSLDDEELISISKYVFKPERFSPVTLFKLYEVASKEIFALSNWSYDDFHKWYHKRNFTGLKFELIAEFEEFHTSHSTYLKYKSLPSSSA